MNNDQEWRVHLLSEIKELRREVHEIKTEMTSLKVKVALFSSFIGSVATVIANKFFQ